ncbi:hypothetical protein IMCC21224_11869 [Puniceibacterium sp. IMCC21224]|nr:hypothetical protein IMCC21224_11869 [Puniceibacterium sp. IMCC21224]
MLGPYAHAVLGEPGGLTQFGAHIEVLPPESRSSYRQWHEKEDELIYLLSGELVLVEEVETPLMPGDLALWPAGAPVGHCLENRSNADATYLTVGSRQMQDVVHYPDAGLTMQITGRRHRVFRDASGTEVARYSDDDDNT